MSYSILKGNLAPNGAVAKITEKEGLYFKGEAIVFENELEFLSSSLFSSNKKKSRYYY